jgi:hypothetical protein
VNEPLKPLGDLVGMGLLVRDLLTHADRLRAQTNLAWAARDLGMQGPAGDTDLATLESVCRAAHAVADQIEHAVGLVRHGAARLQQQLAEYEQQLQTWRQQAGL